MQARTLGTEGLVVSALGLGCMGLTAFYGRDTKAADATAVIHHATDLGITLLDTADAYGPFTNEVAVGRAISDRRDRVVVSTKFGVERAEDGTTIGLNGRPEYVRRACEGSLARLATDYIDVYILHRVDPATPVEETVGGMADLVREGKIRHLGLSEVSPETVRRAHAVHAISVVESEYSLWSRDIEDEELPVLRELGVGFIAYSPLGRGFLTGAIRSPEDLAPHDWRRESPRFQGANFVRNLELVDQVRAIAASKGITPAQLALAWLLRRDPAVVPIQGATTVEQLDENAGAVEVSLDEDELAEIERVAPRGAAAGARAPSAYMDQIDR